MRVLFFAPHAGIWQHAFPEALVAESLRAAGAEIIYVTCDGALAPDCVTIAAYGKSTGTAAERAAVCVACRENRDLLRSGFRFGGYDLDSVLEPDDERRIQAIVEVADRGDVLSLEVDGVEVGRPTLYEFLIQRKKLSFTLDDAEWQVFRPRLEATIRSVIAAARIIERERPDRILAYNSLYSVNAVWRALASARGIPFYFVHGGLSLKDRLQHLLVGRDSTLAWWSYTVAAWPRFRDVPCRPHELARVTDHFLQLFRGTSVFAYSAPKSAGGTDVRARFGVGPTQRLLVATMSSYDEYIAAVAVGGAPDQRTLLFPTQIEWVRALTRWISSRPDLFLILRVHPREFPNKREGLKSEHATALEAELATLPPNVRVNWPAEQLSIYDLAEQADVFLNAWSSVGKEMALLGLPVVSYCPTVIQYAPELNYIATSEPAYFAAIDAALRDGWSFERMRLAFRWCVLEYVRGLVDIGDAFHYSEDASRSLRRRVENALLALPTVRQRRDLWRRPPAAAAATQLAELVTSGAAALYDLPTGRRAIDRDVETMALRVQIRRLVQGLYPGPGTPAPGSLRERLTNATRGSS